MNKHRQTKATDISKAVKQLVWERDHHACILCGSRQATPNAHYISRAKGGKGVERNVVTLCGNCHREYDQSSRRQAIKQELRSYLMKIYPKWNEEELIYKKGEL